MLEEIGMPIDGGIHMETDASAAIGVAKRSGVGKLRHLHVCFLWLQEQVKLGNIILHKIPGDQNTADIYTKYLSAQEMKKKLFNEDFTNVELRGPIGKRVVKKVSFDLSSNQVCVYASKAISQFNPSSSHSVCSMSREDRNTWMQDDYGSQYSLRKSTQITESSYYHDDTYFPDPSGWDGECRWWDSPLPDSYEGGWYQSYDTNEYSGWDSSSPVKRTSAI